MVLEKTPESPLDCKAIKSVNPKGNQSWIFIGRTDVETEALVLWPSDVKNWLIGKDPDTGKAKGEGGDRGWDGWMASLTQRTWVWASFGSGWWIGKPGVLTLGSWCGQEHTGGASDKTGKWGTESSLGFIELGVSAQHTGGNVAYGAGCLDLDGGRKFKAGKGTHQQGAKWWNYGYQWYYQQRIYPQKKKNKRENVGSFE